MFKEKYTTTDLKAKDVDGEKDKILLTNDAYAVGEMLEILINTWRNK